MTDWLIIYALFFLAVMGTLATRGSEIATDVRAGLESARRGSFTAFKIIAVLGGATFAALWLDQLSFELRFALVTAAFLGWFSHELDGLRRRVDRLERRDCT